MIVRRDSMRRAGGLAVVSLLAFALGTWFLPERMPVALARIFAPLADIPPASDVSYTVKPGDARCCAGTIWTSSCAS